MTQHLSAVTCLVRDQDEALRFFRDTLGFDVLEDTELEPGKRWVMVAPAAGGTALRLALPGTPAQVAQVGNQAGGRVAFFLETDDLKGDYYRLVSRGVRFLEAPRDESYGTVAVFADLYGNRWDLVQPGAALATSLEKPGELPVAAVRGDEEDEFVLPPGIPVTLLTASPLLRLMLALEGMEGPVIDPMRAWAVFRRFIALPAEAAQDVATFQATWVTEIDGPPILFCVLARQLTVSVRGMAETTRSIQVEFSFEAEYTDELEDIEAWSDEFETLDDFAAHVEELPHFEIMAQEKPVLCNVSEESNAQT